MSTINWLENSSLVGVDQEKCSVIDIDKVIYPLELFTSKVKTYYKAVTKKNPEGFSYVTAF